jgi:uncharacterized protein HemY
MEDAIRRHPSDFWLHFYVGRERLRRNEVEAAVGSLRAAVAVRPEVPFASELLSTALARRNTLKRDPAGVP